MSALSLLSQRFMVSPDGLRADWVCLDEIAGLGADWTDCTDMGDVELSQLMERRMKESAAARAAKLQMAA